KTGSRRPRRGAGDLDPEDGDCGDPALFKSACRMGSSCRMFREEPLDRRPHPGDRGRPRTEHQCPAAAGVAGLEGGAAYDDYPGVCWWSYCRSYYLVRDELLGQRIVAILGPPFGSS